MMKKWKNHLEYADLISLFNPESWCNPAHQSIFHLVNKNNNIAFPRSINTHIFIFQVLV